MSYHDTNVPRDYGGWRRRRGIGMFGFGAAGTAAVLGALLVLISNTYERSQATHNITNCYPCAEHHGGLLYVSHRARQVSGDTQPRSEQRAGRRPAPTTNCHCWQLRNCEGKSA